MSTQILPIPFLRFLALRRSVPQRSGALRLLAGCMALLLGLFLACAGGGNGGGGSSTPTPSLPAIQSFTANPGAIQGGQSSALSWSVTGATSLSIDQGVGSVTGTTAKIVTPATTTTYTLTAANSAGSVNQTVTVNVTSGQLPIISAFSASPSTINSGQSTLLSWTVANATSLSISGLGPVTPMGSGGTLVSPTVTTSYTLTASNAAGSVTQTTTVTVTTGQLPVINSFTSSPATITSGQSSTLAWSVSGATDLSIDPGVGSVTGLNSKVVSPATTTTYTLTARNAAGSVTQTVSVNVMVVFGTPTISSFTASPASINPGQSSTLAWSVSGATSLAIDQGVGIVTGQASAVVAPTATTTYKLYATNAVGVSTQTVTVTVAAGQLPVIASFTASPSTITAGQNSTLAWSVSGATSLSLDQGIGVVTGSFSRSVSPSATTTYRLTASNAAGSVNQTVTITVAALQLPHITSFTATPAVITAGQTSTLAWAVTGATALAIDHGVGTVTGFVQSTVGPATTTTYTLTASNAAGSVLQTVTVTVNAAPPPAPTIASFTATPANITAGQSSTLAWSVTGATSLGIDQGVGAVTGLASKLVSPGATTTYTLTASNAGGSVTRSVTITVNAASTTTTFYPVADNAMLRSTTNTAAQNTVYSTSDLAVGINWAAGAFTWDYVYYATALRFDLSSLSGKTITSATLTLWVKSSPANTGTTYQVAAFAGGWNPATLTYANSPGIYLSPKVIVNPPAYPTPTMTVDLKAIVSNWTSGVWANNGIWLGDNNYTYPGYTAYRATIFYSMDVYDSPAHRPTLTVTWQ